MADATPKLPSTTSDLANYAPYSLLAVMAITVAVLFAVLLISMGVSAFMIGQPMVEPILLVFPVAAIALAYAGRKQIDNSEGTRVGMNFCRYAWWIAVIGLIGYVAYMLGISYATKSDAEEAFNRWAKSVVKANPTDWTNVDLGASFHGTLPADKQPSVGPNDTSRLRALYSQQFLAFRQSDIVRLCFRNPDQVKFEVQGLEEWKTDKQATNCRLTVKLICPEGEFTMSAAMQKLLIQDGKALPVWQVMPPQNETTNFMRPTAMTEYGEMIRDLEISAFHLVYEYFLAVLNSKGQQPLVFEAFKQESPEPKVVFDRLKASWECRVALAGTQLWSAPEPVASSPEWLLKSALSGGLNLPEARHRYHAIAHQHFEPLDKGDAYQERKMRETFVEYWRVGDFRKPGTAIPKNPDVGIILVPGEDGWTARVPIEIQPPNAGPIACRGYVVLKLDNKQYLQDMEAARKKTGLHEVKYRPNADTAVPWRIVRIESDLRPQAPPRSQGGD